MNDPLSPLTAPPPRYLLESDSSDEEGQGTYPGAAPGPSKPKIRINEGVKVDITGIEDEVEEVVIGLGQAGRYLLKSVQGEKIGGVKVGSSRIGDVYEVEKGRTISIEEGDLNGDECWEVVKSLVGKLKAKKWTIISSYVPSMYIPSSSERNERLASPPIRVLSASIIEGTKGFDSPNYLTGIAGGLVPLASHPTSSIPIPTTLLLPLPLSSLSPSMVQSSLKSISPGIASTLGQSNKRWTEDDDEPYAAPGMGRVRGLRKGVAEVSSMYM